MKVYVIPMNTLEPTDTVESLFNHNIEDYTILLEGDLTQIWRVAALENFKGEAMVVTSDVTLNKKLNPKRFLHKDTLVCYTADKNVFLINCKNDWFKGTDPNADLSSVLNSHRCHISDELRNHFSPEVSISTPEPAPEPEPTPDSGVEESQNHWDVLDQYPNSGE
jgi:hypothetical protein